MYNNYAVNIRRRAEKNAYGQVITSIRQFCTKAILLLLAIRIYDILILLELEIDAFNSRILEFQTQESVYEYRKI